MIDQQYAEFESLSNLESNARKELKLITKDLEFANATLNKVCDDDTKMQVQVSKCIPVLYLVIKFETLPSFIVMYLPHDFTAKLFAHLQASFLF